ncbi:MAG: glycosyltransferase family 4 protein [bacterium]
MENSSALTICMVSHRLPPEYSGAGQFALNLSMKLASAGIKMRLLTFTENPVLSGDSVVSGLPVRRVLITRRHNILGALTRLWEEARIILEDGGADIIHWQGFLKDMVLAIPAKKILKTRWIFTASLMGYDDFNSIKNYGRIYSHALSRFDGVFVPCPAMGHGFRKSPGFEKNFMLLPFGIDIFRFCPADAEQKQLLRKRLGLPQDRKILCFAGGIVRRKGVQHLLRMMASLKHSESPPVLLLIGPWESDSEELRGGFKRELDAYAASSDIADFLIWTGKVDNLEDYLRASDIFVFPSLREGLAISLLDAIACGLPCVAGLVPGMSDFAIEDGTTGLLVNPEDHASLENTVKKLLNDDSLRIEMGKQGRERAVRMFSLDTAAQQHMEFYRQVVKA